MTGVTETVINNPDAPDRVVVFLGPSLPHARARSILAADYRAPAQMGDIYRVIASDVHTVVLIDGLFHAASEVWQREILEAIAAGVRVIGASSMGALRAAELHTFGMTGVGLVFEWYRDRVIDGDDEVAIMHADASEDFRALSEPLVNIRYRLQHAVARGVLTEQQARALTDHAKQTFFPRRSNRRLLKAKLVENWSANTRARLEEIFRDERFDLKTRDALLCLEWVRDALSSQSTSADEPAFAVPIAAPSRFYRAVSKRKRGFSHPGGSRVTGEMLWKALEKNPAKLAAYRRQAAKNEYLWRLAEHRQVRVPEAFRAQFRDAWEAHHEIDNTPEWRAASSLTESEYATLLDRRTAIAWMLEREPVIPDDIPSAGDDVSEQLAQRPGALSRREVSFLAQWARARGIACPRDVLARVIERTQRVDDTRPADLDLALCEWLLGMQPYHFGYTSWSPIVAVLEELQITGRAVRLVGEHRGRDD